MFDGLIGRNSLKRILVDFLIERWKDLYVLSLFCFFFLKNFYYNVFICFEILYYIFVEFVLCIEKRF